MSEPCCCVLKSHDIQESVPPKYPFLSIPTMNFVDFVDFGVPSWPRTAALIILSSGRQFEKSGLCDDHLKKFHWFQTCRGLLVVSGSSSLSLWFEDANSDPKKNRIFASFPLRGRAENLRNEDKLAQCQDIPTSL
eukprot:s2879_g7.t1